MDIESGHEEVYKPMMTKKHAPPESRASRRYALFLTATKVLCLLMVLSLLGYYVYVTVTMDDATAQLVRDVSKLQQHHHHRHNKTSNDDVPEWFTQVLNLTRKGFVHISLQPFPLPNRIGVTLRLQPLRLQPLSLQPLRLQPLRLQQRRLLNLPRLFLRRRRQRVLLKIVRPKVLRRPPKLSITIITFKKI